MNLTSRFSVSLYLVIWITFGPLRFLYVVKQYGGVVVVAAVSEERELACMVTCTRVLPRLGLHHRHGDEYTRPHHLVFDYEEL